MTLLATLAQAESCKADGPLLTDKAGKPTWLNTKALVKRANHCVAPRMPTFARQARIEGQVLVDILVDQQGKVACVQLIHGHPMLAGSAIEAAKDWTFRPMKKSRQAVSFYGHLGFYFSTGQIAKGESPCTVAHW
jgi:TonB family protein